MNLKREVQKDWTQDIKVYRSNGKGLLCLYKKISPVLKPSNGNHVRPLYHPLMITILLKSYNQYP